MKYARMTNGTAAEVVSPQTWATFNDAVQALFIEAPAHIERGWTLDGGEWSAPEPPPAPEPQPRPLSRLQFEGLVQQAAQLTDAQFIAALDDANLRLMWHRLNIASQVERDHELTQAGMAALVATGHLTEAQVQAIMDAWPDA